MVKVTILNHEVLALVDKGSVNFRINNTKFSKIISNPYRKKHDVTTNAYQVFSFIKLNEKR